MLWVANIKITLIPLAMSKRRKKIPSDPNRSRTYDLPITSSDDVKQFDLGELVV